MNNNSRRLPANRLWRYLLMFAAALYVVLLVRPAAAQGVTGTLIGTVRDAQSAVLTGATVRLTSPALIGGSATQTTNAKGQFRFPELPPASHGLDVEFQGFSTFHEDDIHVGAGATIERTPVLTVAGLATSVVVTNPDGMSSRLTGAFTYVVDPPYSLTASPNSVAAGSQVSVSWTAPRGGTWDWIGFFEVGGFELYEDYWYRYTDGAPSGTLTLIAPSEPGQYEFRYFLDDGFAETARTSPVTVTPATAARER